MGKGFLDSLDDAFGEDMLVEVIPVARKKRGRPPEKKSEKEKTHPSSSRSAKRGSGRKRKSFFDTIEEVLDQQSEGDGLALPGIEAQLDQIEHRKLRRLSAMISGETLARLKRVAERQGIPFSELVEKAIAFYLRDHQN